MAYVYPNFKTKKELREALKAGREINVFQPNDMFGGMTIPVNGVVQLEGPHYPRAHTWYGRGTMVNGRLTRVK